MQERNKSLSVEIQETQTALIDGISENEGIISSVALTEQVSTERMRTNRNLYQRMREAQSRVAGLLVRADVQDAKLQDSVRESAMLSEENAILEKKITKLSEENVILEKKITKLSEENISLKKKITTQTESIGSLLEENSSLRSELATVSSDLHNMMEELHSSPCRCDCASCLACHHKQD